MKYGFAFALAATAALVGCQNPDIAQRELGEDEKNWEAFVSESYPAWEPNETLPPGMKLPEQPAPESAATAPESKPEAPAPESAVVPPPEASAGAETAVAGKSPEESASPVAKETKYTEYTVAKGDSLSRIAKKFYGDGRKYYRIYKANQSAIPDINKLKAGTVLRIPEL